MNVKKKWYEKFERIILILASIVTITGFSFYTIFQYINMKSSDILTQAELDDKVKSLGQEVELLDLQLYQLSRQSEYIMKNGEENKIDVSEVLDYHMLISKMDELRLYYYFIDLITFMDEQGYGVEGYKVSLLTEQFFRMDYEEQADILANMFIYTKPYTYKVATDYSYYADVTEYEGYTEYSNITAEATNIEERSIAIYICRELMDNPFGLIRRTDKNENITYKK